MNQLRAQPPDPRAGAAPAKALPGSPHVLVAPVARPARMRRRHLFLALSFLLLVAAPLALSAWYLYARAADQYASSLGFSVRTEETSTPIELFGGVADISSSSTTSDTDILFAYLTSQDLVRRIDEAVDLRAIWSRVPYSEDPVFAYDAPGTIEDLVDHWERMVTIAYDHSAGMIEVRVLAFDPDDAQRINRALLAELSDMINRLSDIAREDEIRYAREELEKAVARLREARTAVTAFRNRHQIVDPAIDVQNQMGVLTTLQQQLAEAMIELDLLRDRLPENDTRVTEGARRVAVIEARIAAERRKLGLGASATDGEVFATTMGEFEGLLVDREYAEEAYTKALAAYDEALAEARRKSRYLAAYILPTRAETSEYPEREKLLSLIALFCLSAWAIVSLVYYSLRDRG